MNREPQTPQEWQVAVDAAEGVLASEFIRALGFISKGGEFNIARCVDVLERGRDQGIIPSETAIKDWFGETSDEADVEKIYRVFLTAHEMSGHPDLAAVVPFLTAEEYA